MFSSDLLYLLNLKMTKRKIPLLFGLKCKELTAFKRRADFSNSLYCCLILVKWVKAYFCVSMSKRSQASKRAKLQREHS